MNISKACSGLLLGMWLAVAPLALAQSDGYALPPAQVADYSTILNSKSDSVVVFDYGGRSAILIIDFPSLAEQGKMFNRVVALIERIGAPRQRVLDNTELAQFIRSIGKTDATLAYGNDFLIAELVVFFNLADMAGIQLTAQEVALRQLLLDRRFMAVRNGFFQTTVPHAVILSIPQESAGSPGSPPVSALARRTILMHEISHGEYYSNSLYANHCRRFWREAMTEEQRTAFRKFLSGSSYNPESQEMMVNETQAYLLYTPDTRAFNAKLVGLKEQEIEALRARFLAGFPDAPLAELRK